MSRLSDLLRQIEAKDPQLAADLKREFDALSKRRAFGMNFERHVPETVELPGRPIRRGDKVRFLPERGESPRSVDRRLWRVKVIRRAEDGKAAQLVRQDSRDSNPETATRAVDDLVVVAEFRDPIYPGLVSTGKVERGGDKPFHTVINAENFHALQALLYTHEGNVDAIYIDPPYNTGARDWKYNNDYVDSDDAYCHSKWLAMMERRLKLAKRLLKPEDSVLIVTIDEKEYLRLGLLLDQTFPDAKIQMVSSVINPAGAGRSAEFSRTDEYLFFVRIGEARVLPEQRDEEQRPVTWDTLRRSDLSSVRPTRPGQFYPFYVNPETQQIEEVGDPLPPDISRFDAPEREGCVAVFPVRPDGTEMNWGITAEPARRRVQQGYIRIGRYTPDAPQQFVISYLTSGIISDIASGRVEVTRRAENGSVIASYVTGRLVMPTTAWNQPAHDAQRYGTEILKALIPNRRFPFPKSLYAVEDCLRHFVAESKRAVIVDFFAGSGTTTHAVMRLNKQDGGQRQSISVTNNEVGADEQAALREKGLRPGDSEWENWGICDYFTNPRVAAAITGKTPESAPIKGNYKFTDEFPMAEGFEENIEFFTMTYEAPRSVAHHRSFAAIAPLLWLKVGAQGRRIEKPTDDFDIADTYGILFDLDQSHDFIEAISKADGMRTVFLVTDDDRAYQAVCAELPGHVKPMRLYESYLTSFTINTGKE